jgi:hypothetical protein
MNFVKVWFISTLFMVASCSVKKEDLQSPPAVFPHPEQADRIFNDGFESDLVIDEWLVSNFECPETASPEFWSSVVAYRHRLENETQEIIRIPVTASELCQNQH